MKIKFAIIAGLALLTVAGSLLFRKSKPEIPADTQTNADTSAHTESTSVAAHNNVFDGKASPA